MSAPKPFASLGPTLLARKGAARPAMRPQLVPMSALASAQEAEALAADLEDLGWNDMGDMGEMGDTGDVDGQGEALTSARSAQGHSLALTPAPLHPQAEAAARRVDAVARGQLAAAAAPAPELPEVLRQRRAAAAEVTRRARATVPAPRAAGTAAAAGVERAARRSALAAGRRAAFTLRLDARRHLLLRLASTVQNSSAQQLVTAALDRYLADLPDIETLADQVKRDRHDR